MVCACFLGVVIVNAIPFHSQRRPIRIIRITDRSGGCLQKENTGRGGTLVFKLASSVNTREGRAKEELVLQPHKTVLPEPGKVMGFRSAEEQ